MEGQSGLSGSSTQQWVRVILNDPAKFQSMFVVHTDTDVLFVSAEMGEAANWMKAAKADFGENLRLFLVPNNFGQVRLRMLKIKSLSAGE